jgi:hypothetical protein
MALARVVGGLVLGDGRLTRAWVCGYVDLWYTMSGNGRCRAEVRRCRCQRREVATTLTSQGQGEDWVRPWPMGHG